jgi:membrane protein
MPPWLLALEQRARNIAYGIARRIPAPPVLRALFDLIVRTSRNFARDDGSHMAAGVAYYAVFSLFPLALVTITVASFVLDEATVHQRLHEFMDDQLPGSTASDFVRTNIERLSAARGAVGVVAIVALLWASRAVFGAVHRVVNRAWKTTPPREFFVNQVGQMLGAAVAAVLFTLSAVFGVTGRLLARIDLFSAVPWGTILTVAPFLLTTPVVIMIYKFVPDTRVQWRQALPAGLIVSVGLELTKLGFAYYLANLSYLDLVYGSIATVVVMMVFFYIASLILVWGAELGSEISRSSAAGMLGFRGRLRPVRGGLLSDQQRPGAGAHSAPPMAEPASSLPPEAG